MRKYNNPVRIAVTFKDRNANTVVLIRHRNLVVRNRRKVGRTTIGKVLIIQILHNIIVLGITLIVVIYE